MCIKQIINKLHYWKKSFTGDFANFILTKELKQALDIIEKNEFAILFITGKAGTGKSTFLKYIKLNILKHNAAYLAPTGVAAVNIQGQTIHSFFKFPPRFITLDEIKKSKDSKLYQMIDFIVIDECSMLKADIFEGINQSLQISRNNNLPFGGVKVILFGDLYQLPPVVDRETAALYGKFDYKTPYFFSSKIFKKLLIPNNCIKVIELTHIFRQKDENYIDILEKIRHCQTDNQLFNILDNQVVTTKSILPKNITILTTTNKLAKKYNEENLLSLSGPSHKYKAIIAGDFKETEYPTDEIIELKKGAKILFIKNDLAKRWVNGSIGFVSKLFDNYIIALINGQKVIVEMEKWEKIQYTVENGVLSYKIIGSFKQLPLRLGWAITIHKSQGLTLDNILVDTSTKAFASGQIYVALSRCRSLSDLYLQGSITNEDLLINSDVNRFIEYMKSKNNYA